MDTYLEYETGIKRSYDLEGPIQQFQSDKALIEIVPSSLFGKMLYIDGCLQLAKKDEYIYHEMLVHPAMASAVSRKKVCILGGGDGCALREVLKWADVEEVTVIDWDSRLVYLFQGEFASWNLDSFHDPRVTIKIANVLDLVNQTIIYDLLFVDLLDPDCGDKENVQFWQKLITLSRSWVSAQGQVVFNAGGFFPWNTRTLEWLTRELRYEWKGSNGHELLGYHVFVPSFTFEWCFFMVRPTDLPVCLSTPFDSNRKWRHFDEAAWTLATTWTKEYRGVFATSPVNLSNWLTQL